MHGFTKTIFTNKNIHAKEFGFIFPSSEIYDGLSATYDYGQNGVELKNNIKKYWWKSMVQMNENIVGVDAAIFMHPNTWKASGHIDAFNDPLIDNKDSKKRYRADVLLEDHLNKIENKINKEINKGRKRIGDKFNKTEFVNTNPNVLRRKEEIHKIETPLNTNSEGTSVTIKDTFIYLEIINNNGNLICFFNLDKSQLYD